MNIQNNELSHKNIEKRFWKQPKLFIVLFSLSGLFRKLLCRHPMRLSLSH